MNKKCYYCRPNNTGINLLHDIGKQDHTKLLKKLKRGPISAGKNTRVRANENGSIRVELKGIEIATLYKNGDTTVHFHSMSIAAQRRWNRLFEHRGAASFLFDSTNFTVVYVDAAGKKVIKMNRIASAIAERVDEYHMWKYWKNHRWLVTADSATFYKDKRPPRGLVQWHKNARRPKEAYRWAMRPIKP